MTSGHPDVILRHFCFHIHLATQWDRLVWPMQGTLNMCQHVSTCVNEVACREVFVLSVWAGNVDVPNNMMPQCRKLEHQLDSDETYMKPC